MDREISWNLGLWRGENGYPLAVRLAPTVDLEAYRKGFEYGALLRSRKVQ